MIRAGDGTLGAGVGSGSGSGSGGADRLAIDPADMARIRAEAEAAWPAECCGLLVGRDDPAGAMVTRVVPTVNVLASRQRDRFEIDPAARFALMRALRTAGRGAEDPEPCAAAERIIGHYHSHPDGPARPSATDAAMVFEPDLVWVIVAVKDGRAGTIGAFRPARLPTAGPGEPFTPMVVVVGEGP